MTNLPSLKKVFCPFCDKWIVNTSLGDEGLFIHDDVIHPYNAANFFTDKRTDN